MRIISYWRAKRRNGRIHKGIDISAPYETSVISPQNGWIAKIGSGKNAGNYL